MSNRVQHRSVASISYTIYLPKNKSEKLSIFIPGVATNRYGQTQGNGPSGNVRSAFVDLIRDSYNVVFPEIYDLEKTNKAEPIQSVTVEDQSKKILTILKEVINEFSISELLIVSECYGSLVVGNIARDPVVSGATSILWSPCTYEGESGKTQMINAFRMTDVGQDGTALMPVTRGDTTTFFRADSQFWNSMNRNSLRTNYKAMLQSYKKIAVFHPSHDLKLPDSIAYFSEHLPGFEYFSIEGVKHRFSTESMREQLRLAMRDFLERN